MENQSRKCRVLILLFKLPCRCCHPIQSRAQNLANLSVTELSFPTDFWISSLISMDERCHPINKLSQWQHLTSQTQYPMTLENHDGLPMKLPQPRRSSSHTIPLPSSHIPRTQSELQLCDDMAAAEWRDLCMFHRVVNGIRDKHRRSDGVSATMFEQSTEGCPTHTYLHESPSSKDEWSISGYSDHQMEKVMPQQHRQIPRQSITWPSTTSSPFVIEQSKISVTETSSYLDDDDAVFSLDL